MYAKCTTVWVGFCDYKVRVATGTTIDVYRRENCIAPDMCIASEPRTQGGEMGVSWVLP